ncbi:MAG: DUF2516 family protein [Actinomycetia bacterium]|nr:DUF2516 family protein [Actinomycetes bacterium]
MKVIYNKSKGEKMKKLLPILLLVTLLVVMATGCTAEDAVGTGISIFLFVCYGILGIIGLLLFILWIVALVDCVKRGKDEFPNAGENTKTIWLVVLIVTFVVNFWWVAAIVYYFMVMKKMPRKK